MIFTGTLVPLPTRSMELMTSMGNENPFSVIILEFKFYSKIGFKEAKKSNYT